MSTKSIIFVTGNKNKLAEVQSILGKKYKVISHKVDRKKQKKKKKF